MDIFCQSKSDIITSKAGKKYFTIKNDENTTFVCFNPKYHPLFEVGNTTVDVEVQEGKKEGDSPRIVSIGTKAEDVVGIVEKLIPHKVDDIKNRGVAISYAKDLVCSGQIKLDQMSAYADKFLEYIKKVEP